MPFKETRCSNHGGRGHGGALLSVIFIADVDVIIMRNKNICQLMVESQTVIYYNRKCLNKEKEIRTCSPEKNRISSKDWTNNSHCGQTIMWFVDW